MKVTDERERERFIKRIESEERDSKEERVTTKKHHSNKGD